MQNLIEFIHNDKAPTKEGGDTMLEDTKSLGWQIPSDQAIEATAKDIKDWAERNNKGMFLNKVDIVQYTGLSRNMIDKLLYGMPTRGTKSHYYYKDVAGCLARTHYK